MQVYCFIQSIAVCCLEIGMEFSVLRSRRQEWVSIEGTVDVWLHMNDCWHARAGRY